MGKREPAQDESSDPKTSTAWVDHQCKLRVTGLERKDGLAHIYSGGQIRVSANVTFAAQATLASAKLSLRYRAEGSGSPETHELQRRTLLQGDVEPGQQVTFDELMSIPESAPMTYEGVYVKIHWAITVELLGVEGQLAEHTQPFVVAARPVDWALEAPPEHQPEPEPEPEPEPDEERDRASKRRKPKAGQAASKKPAAHGPFRVADPAHKFKDDD